MNQKTRFLCYGFLILCMFSCSSIGSKKDISEKSEAGFESSKDQRIKQENISNQDKTQKDISKANTDLDKSKQETASKNNGQSLDSSKSSTKDAQDQSQASAERSKQAKDSEIKNNGQKTETQPDALKKQKNSEEAKESGKIGVVAIDGKKEESLKDKESLKAEKDKNQNKKKGPYDREFEIDVTDGSVANFKMKWKEVGTLPVPNNSFGIVLEENKVYVLGGYTEKGYSADFWELDLIQKKWKALPPLPSPRAGFSTVYFYGKIYVIGGINESGPLNQVDIYDFSRSKWIAGPPLKIKRFQHDTVLLNDRIIVIGGTGENNKSCEYLEPNGNVWKDFPELNMGRDSHRALNFNGSLIVIGGKSKGGIQKIEVLSSPHYQWNFYDDMVSERFGFAALKHEKGILILGGFKDISGTTFFDDVFIYYIYSKTSKALTSLPAPLANFGAILYKNSIYIFGGRNQQGLQDKILRMDIDNENLGNN